MGVGPAIRDRESTLGEARRQRGRVLAHALHQPAELVGRREPEGDRLAGDRVDVRAALFAREHREIDLARQFRLGREQHRPARPAQRLVSGKRDDVRVADRIRELTGCDQPRRVGDVGEQVGADLIGDRTEARPIDRPRIGRVAGDDQPRLFLDGISAQLLEVDSPRRRIDDVGDDLEVLARAIHRRPVGQVAARREVHPHHRRLGRHQRLIDRVVGRRAGERLHVGVDRVGRHLGGRKELGQAADRLGLDQVHVVATLVVAAVAVAPVEAEAPRVPIEEPALADRVAGRRVALGIEIGEGRADRLAHRLRAEALRRDEDQLLPLPLGLGADQPGNPRIDPLERGARGGLGQGCLAAHAAGGDGGRTRGVHVGRGILVNHGTAAALQRRENLPRRRSAVKMAPWSP